MTKKELHAALDIQAKIQRLREGLSNIEQSLGKSPDVRVQGGCAVSAGQLAAEKIEEITAAEKQLEIEQVIIQRYLDKSPIDDAERKIMELHYVRCLQWYSADKDDKCTVAKVTSYSKSRLYQLRQSALQKIGLN